MSNITVKFNTFMSYVGLKPLSISFQRTFSFSIKAETNGHESDHIGFDTVHIQTNHIVKQIKSIN